MFKLIQWIACGFLFYFIYDVMRSVDRAGLPTPRRGARPANITGRSGQGTLVPVEDADGAHRTANVGRGVVS